MTEQIALFRAPESVIETRSRRHAQMLRMYGACEGRQCAQCQHLVRWRPGQNTYLKCGLTVITAGPGSDWRARWPACGRWEERVR